MVEAAVVVAEVSPCPFIPAGVEGAVTMEAVEGAVMMEADEAAAAAEVLEVEVGGAVVVSVVPVI